MTTKYRNDGVLEFEQAFSGQSGIKLYEKKEKKMLQ